MSPPPPIDQGPTSADGVVRVEQSPPEAGHANKHDLGTVAGFLMGPVAYLLDLMCSYAVVEKLRATQNKLPLHAIAFTAMAIALLGVVTSYRSYRRYGQGSELEEDTGSSHAQRERFLAIGGIGLGMMALALIIAGELPNLIVGLRD